MTNDILSDSVNVLVYFGQLEIPVVDFTSKFIVEIIKIVNFRTHCSIITEEPCVVCCYK